MTGESRVRSAAVRDALQHTAADMLETLIDFAASHIEDKRRQGQMSFGVCGPQWLADYISQELAARGVTDVEVVAAGPSTTD